MITQFRLENFKGHRDTVLALERFTVLVGDNGSGKTSVLEALGLPGMLERGVAVAPDELLRQGAKHLTLSFDGRTNGQRWTASLAMIAPEAALTAPDHNAWGVKASGVDTSGMKFSETDSWARTHGPIMDALRRIASLLGYTARAHTR